MPNPSPLRYPGGKNKLSQFMSTVIKNMNFDTCTYIEPFAGGAGIALSLLLDGTVDRIVINDYDKAIYSFWRSIKEEPDELKKRIHNTPITIDEWYKQKDIYVKSKSYSLDLAFATLFLNRTNHSGILNAGPIGGYAQDGDWKLDVRFNKDKIIDKIEKIAKHRNKITVYNKDIISLLTNYAPRFAGNQFYYFDPPYYNKGQELYKNFFNANDHKRIRDKIANEIMAPWIITYDDVDEIVKLYNNYSVKRFELTYSAANKGTATELMIFSDDKNCPTSEQIKQEKIKINLRG